MAKRISRSRPSIAVFASCTHGRCNACFEGSRIGLYRLIPSSQIGENANRVSARSSLERWMLTAIAFGLA